MKITTKNTVLALALSSLAALAGGSNQHSMVPTSGLAGAEIVSGLVERASANSTVTRRLRLEGGIVHHVFIQGDGDTDLDAVLKDEFGNVVASDRDATDLCILPVEPRWTGEFTLEIQNLGGVYNEFVLTVL